MIGRRAVLAALALMAGLVSLSAPGGVDARRLAVNQVERNGTVVTITVPIDLHVPAQQRYRVPGAGTTGGAGLAAWWESGAEAIWNSGLSPFLFRGCYTLKVDIQLNVVAADPFSGNSDHHQVYLRGSAFRSKVARGGGAGKNEDDPNTYTHPGLGYWGMVGPTTVAHEVGHLLGLADDYTDVKNASGQTTGAQSLPGREKTLMDNYRQGSAATWFDQELVDRLGDMAGIVEPLPPCFQGTVTLLVEDAREGHYRAATLDLALAVSPNEAGELEGLATGSFDLSGSVTQGGCEFSYNGATDVSLELTASGQANGPYTVTAKEEQRYEETQRHFLCDDPVDLQIDWDIGLTIEDIIFRDREYRFSDGSADVVLFYSRP
ncbi:MAG TPA: hypothetical protein VFI11_07405 [Anaerolineales bacterium]|nr:hypothetical protein [Anaerolineales bacterium]